MQHHTDLVWRNRDWRIILSDEGAHKWIVKKGEEKKTREVLLLAMFIFWRERCARIFRDQIQSAQDLVNEVQQQWNYVH